MRVSLLACRDLRDRRRKVRDVEPALQTIRQRRVLKIHDNAVSLLANVDVGVRVGQIDYNPTFVLGARRNRLRNAARL